MVRISLFPALTPLYLYVSTFRRMCAMPNMAFFCSSLTSWFPGVLLTYFLNYFEMVPVAPIITGITFGFTFDMRCISIVKSLYFRIFSASFLITFLSPETATSINIHIIFHYHEILLLLLILLLLSLSLSLSLSLIKVSVFLGLGIFCSCILFLFLFSYCCCICLLFALYSVFVEFYCYCVVFVFLCWLENWHLCFWACTSINANWSKLNWIIIFT